MSEFIAIIGNVKIIRCLQNDLPEVMRSDASDRLTDSFPPVDVFTRGGIVHIFADVPGMSADDIFISVYGDFVVIEGMKRGTVGRSGYEYIRFERHFPSFKRTFRLPLLAERYEAVLNDGVLHIVLAAD